MALEDYKILRKIGEGGFAEAYEARNKENQPVCIKTSLTPDFGRIFEREAKILSELSHPGIPQLIEFQKTGKPGSQDYHLVMDLKKGRDLRTILSNEGPMAEKTARDVTWKVLDILSHMHKQSKPICHLDVKIENILVSNDGNVSLIDFGSARKIDEPLGSTISATPRYIPMEVWQREFAPQTDLFQAGVVFAAAVSKMAYNPISMDMPYNQQEIEDLKNKNALVPGMERFLAANEETIGLIKYMTQHDREKRAKSADEIKNILESIAKCESSKTA